MPYSFDEKAGPLLPMDPGTGDIHSSAEPLGNQLPPEIPYSTLGVSQARYRESRDKG